MRKDSRDLPLTHKKPNGDYFKVLSIDGKYVPTKEYIYWTSAKHRTKTPYKLRFPSYEVVGFDQTIQDFNLFVEWCHKQVGFSYRGYVMDKDILGVVCGYKNYSTETCVFIPARINAFLISKNKAVKHYTGVSFQQECQKYIVSCSQLNGKNKTLARVNCPVEGYNIYKAEKVRLAKVLAAEYEGKVDRRVTDILSNFENYIDLFTVNPTNKETINAQK